MTLETLLNAKRDEILQIFAKYGARKPSAVSSPAFESARCARLYRFVAKAGLYSPESVERKLIWLSRELELLGIQAILRGNTVSAGGAL